MRPTRVRSAVGGTSEQQRIQQSRPTRGLQTVPNIPMLFKTFGWERSEKSNPYRIPYASNCWMEQNGTVPLSKATVSRVGCGRYTQPFGAAPRRAAHVTHHTSRTTHHAHHTPRATHHAPHRALQKPGAMKHAIDLNIAYMTQQFKDGAYTSSKTSVGASHLPDPVGASTRSLRPMHRAP